MIGHATPVLKIAKALYDLDYDVIFASSASFVARVHLSYPGLKTLGLIDNLEELMEKGDMSRFFLSLSDIW
jgi:UDP:flavonoid glycosyltransferase YjiC (YdhE family)